MRPTEYPHYGKSLEGGEGSDGGWLATILSRLEGEGYHLIKEGEVPVWMERSIKELEGDVRSLEADIKRLEQRRDDAIYALGGRL